MSNKQRDVYMVVLTAILKLKGIGVLCSSLRHHCSVVGIAILRDVATYSRVYNNGSFLTITDNRQILN